MWINTRFQCSHWGNVMLWSAVILNRALGEQLTSQLWLLAGVSYPGSSFSSMSVTAWEAQGELCHHQTIGVPGRNELIQHWLYQEGWRGGSLEWYESLIACTKEEWSSWMNKTDTSVWPPSPVDWARGACIHICSLFQGVVFPLLLPHHFPLSSPLSPSSRISSTISTIHFSGAPKGNISPLSEVLPPLGLSCFPTHPSSPSPLKLCIVPVCSHNSILGFSRPPADLVGSSCKNIACAIRLSDYSWLITGGAASLKGEARWKSCSLLHALLLRGDEKKQHICSFPQLFSQGLGFFRKEFCISPLFKV